MRFAVIVSAVWLALCACSGRDSFRVTANLEDIGVETIVMKYSDGAGYKTVEGYAQKAGKPIVITGISADWTIVEICRSNGAELATFPARNGQKISLIQDDNGDVMLKGSPEIDSLTAFCTRNGALLAEGPSQKLNAAIAQYVRSHDASVAATTLLLTRFDAASQPEQADSLFSLLQSEARPASLIAGWAEQLEQSRLEKLTRRIGPFSIHGSRDSLISFSAISSPYSVIAFVGADRPDSVARAFGRLRSEWSKKRLKLTEIRLSTDSARFTRAMATDTAHWTRGWVVGGAGAPAVKRLSITSVPFFIVTDSTGSQLYRGPSLSAALTTLSNRSRHAR